MKDYRIPENIDMETIEALGKLSEAMEYVERVRGKLYDLHQLMGRADKEFANARDLFVKAGIKDTAKQIDQIIVGRNILENRWTFQVVDEFEDQYYTQVKSLVGNIENSLVQGRKHLLEASMKAQEQGG